MPVTMADKRQIAGHLAARLLATPWSTKELTAAAAEVLQVKSSRSRRDACRRLVARLLAKPRAYPPSPEELIEELIKSQSFDTAGRRVLEAPWLSKPPLEPTRFQPAPCFAGLDVPKHATQGELATWLGLSIAELDWFSGANRPYDQTMIPILQHYTYVFIPKKHGPPRLIESPKPRLKAFQRRILDEILAAVPAHPCAHGFVRGRSALTGAQIHASEAMVVTVDLADFFPSTPLRRVHGVFRSLGYPWAVARALTGLVSTSTPEPVFTRRPLSEGHSFAKRKLFASRHLPQGAPTSPALANLCAWNLDQRLSGLARAMGAAYTRYADDLTFSGDAAFGAKAKRILTATGRIAAEEGYRLNASKTRIMPAQQRQTVTGIVVNTHLNVARNDFDALKALLHNCVRHGAAGQNRDAVANFSAHLDGRVGWIEQLNPQRGAKLRRLYKQIAW